MSIQNLAAMLTSVDLADKSASAPSTPTETPKLLHGGSLDFFTKGKGRKVTFPSDEMIVSGYLDPPEPWVKVSETDSLVAAYRSACAKHGVKPVVRILQQLQSIQSFEDRQVDFNLKGERLDSWQCETLEEIFKRIQFNKVDFEACHLDDESSSALFDMLDYYESAAQLNISFNKNIDYRGWQACARLLKKTSCLSYLDARSTGQNEQTLLILGRALRTGNSLVTLHMENCGLTGRPLVILVAAIKLNNTLKDLYLGENKIIAADGIQLGNLLQANSTLELLDLRNNNLQDLGICHLADGLCQQIIMSGEGLRTLVLWNNHMTHIGMQHINRILLTSQSLITLNLGQNNISNEGIHQLKQGLIHSQTLHYLGIQCCKITCEGSVALAEYIADNQNIKHIDLKENNVQIAGLMALALSLKHNHSMTRLDLDPCEEKSSRTPDGVQDHQKLIQEITSYCKRNKKECEILSETGKIDDIWQDKIPIIPLNSSNSVSPGKKVTFQTVPIIENSVKENQPSPLGSPNPSRFRVSRVYLDSNATEGETSPINSSPIKEKMEQLEKFSLASTTTIKSKFSVPNGIIAVNISNSEEEMYQRSQSLPQRLEQENDPKCNISQITFNGEAQQNSNHIEANETNQESMNNAKNKGKKRNIKRLENSRRSHSDVNYRFQVKKVCNFDEVDADQTLSSQGSEEDSDKSQEDVPEKKTSFFLPDTLESMGVCMNRRMSTPAMPATLRKQEKRNSLNLKLGRQLESLDLRSTVPLSPTRLFEGFEFPLPIVDMKLPPESEIGTSENRQL